LQYSRKVGLPDDLNFWFVWGGATVPVAIAGVSPAKEGQVLEVLGETPNIAGEDARTPKDFALVFMKPHSVLLGFEFLDFWL
jgi:hypothetical protein